MGRSNAPTPGLGGDWIRFRPSLGRIEATVATVSLRDLSLVWCIRRFRDESLSDIPGTSACDFGVCFCRSRSGRRTEGRVCEFDDLSFIPNHNRFVGRTLRQLARTGRSILPSQRNSELLEVELAEFLVCRTTSLSCNIVHPPLDMGFHDSSLRPVFVQAIPCQSRR